MAAHRSEGSPFGQRHHHLSEIPQQLATLLWRRYPIHQMSIIIKIPMRIHQRPSVSKWNRFVWKRFNGSKWRLTVSFACDSRRQISQPGSASRQQLAGCGLLSQLHSPGHGMEDQYRRPLQLRWKLFSIAPYDQSFIPDPISSLNIQFRIQDHICVIVYFE